MNVVFECRGAVRVVLAIVAVSSLVLTSAAGRADAQNVAPPVSVNAELKLDGPKPQVLIYYANETRPTEDVNQLTSWLLGAEDARVRRLGERLKQDLTDFPAVVAAEIEDLRRAATSGQAKKFGLVVFTNGLAKDGKFLYLSRDSRDGTFQTGKLPVPKYSSSILRDSPLTSPDGLASALVAAASQFPPEQHTFILISKSHGSASVVVAPILARSYDPKDRERVVREMTLGLERNAARRKAWDDMVANAKKGAGVNNGAARALGSDKSGNPILGSDKSGNPILDSDKMTMPNLAMPESSSQDVFTGAVNATGTLDPAEAILLDRTGSLFVNEARSRQKHGAPIPVREYLGIPKTVYLSILSAAGRELDMYFPVVFIESCKSELSPEMVQRLKAAPNVGMLHTSDIYGLSYRSLDYPKACANQPTETIAVRLNAALKAKHELDKAARARQEAKTP